MAVVFDHTNWQYAQRDCSPVTSLPISISMWVKSSEDNPAAIRAFAFYGDKDAATDNVWLYFYTDGQIALSLWSIELGINSGVGSDYADGQWHHVVAKIVETGALGTRVRLFVDGVNRGYDDDNAQRPTVTNWDRIAAGALRDSTPTADYSSFSGSIAEMAIWNYGITETDIPYLYNGGQMVLRRALMVQPDSLSGYWSFDEQTGTTVHDYSGNGHDLTMGGDTTPTWEAAPVSYPVGVQRTGQAEEIPAGGGLLPLQHYYRQRRAG